MTRHLKHKTLKGDLHVFAFEEWTVILTLGAGLLSVGCQSVGAQHQLHMQHITTQAQAEALKPGDSMSMTCSKCKDVMVQTVTADNAHVKMMAVGEKVMCHICGGTVEVAATGKGTGKDAEVKHVCSKCGDDAIFCSATKAGSDSMKDMEKEKK